MGAQTVSRIQRHKELDTRTRDFIIKETDREFGIVPIRIEFLVFSTERFHERLLYVRNGSEWSKQYLQP